jgi:hypothetical protein
MIARDPELTPDPARGPRDHQFPGL